MSKTVELPLLEPHEDALQKCAYCPKLSRAACPVSNVEGNETLTPWGKMSMVWYGKRGDVPRDSEHAVSAWACSGCLACREMCDHKNPVATVLMDARATYFEAGVAPEVSTRVVAEHAARAEDNQRGVDAIDIEHRQAARTALLIGCSYVRHDAETAGAAWRAVHELADGEVRAVRACCGLPLRHAGDKKGYDAALRKLAEEVKDADTLVVVDAGCARALTQDVGDAAIPMVLPLSDWLYARLDRLPAGALSGRKLRYHDACQLGRGLGRYEEPRAILARLTGAAPAEMPRCREHGECSGGGGMLPVARPEASRQIADERIAEHREAGAGTLVTACGESLRRFRSRGEHAVDLVALVAEALEVATSG